MAKTTIEIKTNPKFKPLRALYSALSPITVIGAGVLLESIAMQWFGFVVLTLFAGAVGYASSKQNDGLTISQAHKRLNEIEADET